MKKIYEVKTGRSGKSWWIEVPEARGVYSQAKTYRKVPAMAREAIALLLDVPEDSFDIDVTIVGPEAELIEKVEATDAAAHAAQVAAMDSKRAAVRQLTQKEIPVRDIADLLHVSPGYVSQLSK